MSLAPCYSQSVLRADFTENQTNSLVLKLYTKKIRETKKLESIYQCCGSGIRISDPTVSRLSKEISTKTVVQEFRLRALRKDVEEENK
jgi:hypothetical protein